MRNVEAGIVLDSADNGHHSALADAAEFIRRIATTAPAHTVDALIAALPPAPDREALPPESVRLVHNLDRPLFDVFPVGDLTAVSPYADAGAAPAKLTERGELTVITDGDAFAAPTSFFAGGWTVIPRTFRPRRLHGKAYWTTNWLLVGSPNLSSPALLQIASAGNTELAVVVERPERDFANSLPGTMWDERPIEELAPNRHRLDRLIAREQERIGSFDAWEEGEEIVVAGVPDIPVEQWDPQTNAWTPLGTPQHGRLAPPPDVRPHLIRVNETTGRIRQAVVHRTRLLTSQREKPPVTSRGASVLARTPLDLTGVKALEDVLHDLYALESLTPIVGAGFEDRPRRRDQLGAPDATEPETLTEWRGAREDDEPRIPELYRNSWRGERDTLLALIRKALRLDEPTALTGEDELRDEIARPDDDDVEEPAPDPNPPAPPDPARTTASVLNRYRGALVQLLERGVGYVRSTNDPVLADLGFQAVLRLHEELASTQVSVADEVQPLVEPEQLLPQKVRLLDAYLRDRAGRDPNCLATARVHLGLCLRAREQFDPLDWEILERVAHERASDLLRENPFAARAATDAGVDGAELDPMIRAYAERSEWAGFIVEGEQYLDDVDGGDIPLPWVSGADWLSSTTLSSAWKLVGYGAVPGYRHRQRYGVVVRNLQPRPKFTTHAVLTDPARLTIYEAFKRPTDGVWVSRTYSPVTEGRARKTADTGPDSLLDDCRRAPYADVDLDGNHPLVELLLAAGELAIV